MRKTQVNRNVIPHLSVSEYSTLLYAASDNRLPACFQFKVSEQPYTVSSIRPGGPCRDRTCRTFRYVIYSHARCLLRNTDPYWRFWRVPHKLGRCDSAGFLHPSPCTYLLVISLTRGVDPAGYLYAVSWTSVNYRMNTLFYFALIYFREVFRRKPHTICHFHRSYLVWYKW